MVRHVSDNQQLTSGKLIWYRWRTVVVIGLVTLAIEFTAAHVQEDRVEKLAFLPYWIFVPFGLVGFALSLHLGLRKFLAALGARHALTYPPYWIGVALGTAVMFRMFASGFDVGLGLSADAKYNFGIASLGALFLPGAAFIVTWLISTSRKKPSDDAEWKSDPTELAVATLEEWWRNDEPVASPERDLFGHRHIARRMGLRLALSGAPAQALVGMLGAGKTTIRELVSRYLATHSTQPSVDLICVELWPYETPRAAVEGILTAVTEAFANDVQTSQLTGLPARYGELITKLTGVSKWIPHAIEPKPEPPFALLEEFDRVAIAIGKRYVLWVEDLERFAAGHANAPGDSSELERLAPIRALLSGLDRLCAITIVTATTDLYRRFDLEKIARYIENVPQIDMRNVRRILSQVRQEWLAADDIIHCFKEDQRERLGWDGPRSLEDPESARLEATWVGNSIATFARAVAALATSPRVLKQGLLRADEAWKALRGEIDVDDLLALSLLRAASPSAFAIVDKYISSFRGERPHDRVDPLTKFEDELMALEIDARIKEAAMYIVRHVFRDGRNKPQGLASNNHADYWNRFQTIPELAEGSRDQDVLRELRAADDGPVIDRLNDAKRASAVQDFASLIDNQRLVKLLAATIQRELKSDPSNWQEGHAVAIVRIWDMASRRRGEPEFLRMLAVELERGIDLAVSVNLALVHQLIYWFTTSSEDVSQLFDENTRNSIKARAFAAVVDCYAGKGELLARNLKGSKPGLLRWICFDMRETTAGSVGRPFDGWERFVPTVIEALKLVPEVMTVQIATLITRPSRRPGQSDKWVFDREECYLLFGEVDAIVQSFRTSSSCQTSDPRIDAVRHQYVDLPVTRPIEDNIGHEQSDSDRPPE